MTLDTVEDMTVTTALSVTSGLSRNAVTSNANFVQPVLRSHQMLNPNPTCEKECRFVHGMSLTTAMYYEPVYDKHGNNLNPDGNITSSSVRCAVCNREWYATTQYGKTEYKENVE